MKVFRFYPVRQAKKAFEEWGFDHEAFGTAFSIFYNKHFADESQYTKNYYIGIRIDNRQHDGYGAYQLGGSIFLGRLLTKETSDFEFQRQLFATLMHELMHWIQYNFYKWSDEDILAGDDDPNCLAEKMCEKFEKQTKFVIRLYKAITSIKYHGEYQ